MFESGTLVKPPQSRRGKGLSLVYRTSGEAWGLSGEGVYIKTQCEYNCRPSWRLWRSTPTFWCERHALDICAELGVRAPRVLSYREVDGVTELVLEDIRGAQPLPFFWTQCNDARLCRVVRELGRTVGILHRAGWTHGAIGGGHVLIQPGDDDVVWLIDFEKAQPTRSEKKFVRDVARFFRRSPYLRRREKKCFFDGYGEIRGWNYRRSSSAQAFQAHIVGSVVGGQSSSV